MNNEDFVDIMGRLTNLIQNERTAAYNEGIDANRDALRLLLQDVEMLVLKHGFSGTERDSMLSIKNARKILEG